MKRISTPILIMLAVLVLGACAGGARSVESPASIDAYQYGAPAPEAMPTMGIMQDAMPESSTVGIGGGDGSTDTSNAAKAERIVIQNADLTIVVSDVQGRLDQIQNMAQSMGGFVVSSSLYEGYTSDYTPVPEASVTIRVPSEKLDEALGKIKADTVEVQNETRSGQDVTAEYVDLKSRLKTYQAAEQELTRLMDDAQNTDEVVNIFNQLMYYREQIELVQGQIKYYEEASALSAISIRIVAEATIKPVTIGKWEPKGVALEAVQDLIDFWKGFVDFLIRFIIYTLPVLVTIAIPFYLAFLVIRFIIRKLRGNKKKVEPQQPMEEKKS